MEETIIRVEGLSKKYNLYESPMDRMKEALSLRDKCYHKEFYALKDLSFEVRKGEILGIVGTNGSGKSTLLKIITNVLQPSAGNVQVNGKVSALLELGAGFNPEYTGIENIYLNGTMMGYSRKEMEERVQGIIDFAQIGDFIEQPVKMYSSGMFARLAFAVAINVEPDILIIDETLSVGDMRFQLRCMDRMKSMMESGTTVLFVSHDMNVVNRFCTRCLWIRKGQMVMDGETTAVTSAFLDSLKLEKISEPVVETKQEEETEDSVELPPEAPDTIAKIRKFIVTDNRGQQVDEFRLDEPINIEVVYDVYETNVKNPVVGIAVKDLDDGQLCGLNTLLDQVKVPWKRGRNRVKLHYPNGLRLLGGEYYFDVALFDQTAVVRFHYITAVKRFHIIPQYTAEGMFLLPHIWETESTEVPNKWDIKKVP